MIVEDRISCGPAALAEAKAFMRIDGSAEDPVVAELIESACAVCEAFVGQMLIVRGVTERVAASGAWTRLGRTPVASVTDVVLVGGAVAIPGVGANAVDIDENGDGWVRHGGTYFTSGQTLRVAYRAGLAIAWAEMPPALRHGVVRLAAHLYAHRDADEPPAAVAALWRPYRRMPFGRGAVRRGFYE